jgi:hypothetical protein
MKSVILAAVALGSSGMAKMDMSADAKMAN